MNRDACARLLLSALCSSGSDSPLDSCHCEVSSQRWGLCAAQCFRHSGQFKDSNQRRIRCCSETMSCSCTHSKVCHVGSLQLWSLLLYQSVCSWKEEQAWGHSPEFRPVAAQHSELYSQNIMSCVAFSVVCLGHGAETSFVPAVFKGLKRGCGVALSFLDRSEVQKHSLSMAHRDNKWKLLFFPAEQDLLQCEVCSQTSVNSW